MNKTTKLITFLEKTKGYFFVARLCLKVGRDLTEIKESEPDDPALLKKIEVAAKELGMVNAELERTPH